ncbi:MAG: cysteine hydrolase [Alphaproteobacteria bacterium]|nr:cysteine hydrolase [Alphaproteobacteria bacterium]
MDLNLKQSISFYNCLMIILPRVLIIVDMQNGFITKTSNHLLQPIEEIQYKFDHVILTKFYNPDPSPFREILDYHKLSPASDETKLAIKPRHDAFIIERCTYTCVTKILLAHLKNLKVKEIFICGIATEACVLKTVLDLFESNIKTWVIEDLCASDQDQDYHKAGIILLAKLIGPTHIITYKDTLNKIEKY